MKLALLLALLPFVLAGSLRDAVQQSLVAGLDLEGSNNCANKCFMLVRPPRPRPARCATNPPPAPRRQFGQLNYYTAVVQQTTGQIGNNEYRGCVYGCNRCQAQLTNSEGNNTCYSFCKNADYQTPDPLYALDKKPIYKGIVEPDKSCLFGCTVNLCQGFCAGGMRIGGGSTKTQQSNECLLVSTDLVQTYAKVPPSALTVSAECCAGLQNTCFVSPPSARVHSELTPHAQYQGQWVVPNTPPPKGNWNSVFTQTKKQCNGATITGFGVTITKKSTYQEVYDFYQQSMLEVPAICGPPGPAA
jgi:hypothetical protein